MGESSISVIRDERDYEICVILSEYEDDVLRYLNDMYGEEDDGGDDGPSCYFYAEPARTLSEEDVVAMRAGMHKFEVNFWTKFENGRGVLAHPSVIRRAIPEQLFMNGPVSKTCALVWANNREEAIDLARKQLEEANVV